VVVRDERGLQERLIGGNPGVVDAHRDSGQPHPSGRLKTPMPVNHQVLGTSLQLPGPAGPARQIGVDRRDDDGQQDADLADVVDRLVEVPQVVPGVVGVVTDHREGQISDGRGGRVHTPYRAVECCPA
jgi:hypothetical protein